MVRRILNLFLLHSVVMASSFSQNTPSKSFTWNLRSRVDSALKQEEQRWDAEDTAFIVCDMWDYHHSINAVRRLKEFAPCLNAVLTEARRRGATIIHAPSDCMSFYESHPARKRALAVSAAKNAPSGIADWCHRIPEEEKATYPIDQSNGGEDDDLEEHAEWAAHLKSISRNPGTPWQRQNEILTINDDQDYVCAEGDVVWNVLESKGIQNVVLTGVHTNMCVLGRPFGLRQMKRGGKNVILMRDMTDVMYEPNSWPYVSHFEGIDLVMEHIEKYVCPTVTSDQVIGDKPFQFSNATSAAKKPTKTEVTWTPKRVPNDLESPSTTTWWRSLILIPKSWKDQEPHLQLTCFGTDVAVHLNGHPIKDGKIPSKTVNLGALNTLTVRQSKKSSPVAAEAPSITNESGATISLKGRWQARLGDNSAWAQFPIPPQFGASTDYIFEMAAE